MMDILDEALTLSEIKKATIAGKMGVSRAYITQMVSGHKNLTLKTITDFCKCCGFELEIKLKRIRAVQNSGIVPDSLKWLFWEVDFSKLDPVEHKAYLLSRILNRGDREAIKWMMDTYPKRQILNYINKHKRQLDARSLNFWAVTFGKEEKWIPPSAPASTASWQKLQGANP
jgi:hypothetical protein